MGVTIYDGNIREREMLTGLDKLSNLHDALFDRYVNKKYDNAIGSFLFDVDKLVKELAPEGLDVQLLFMRDYRNPRPYERELQIALNKLYNDEPHGDVKLLLQLTMQNLSNGKLNGAYIGSDDLSRLSEDKFRKHEILKIYDKLGMGGVILVLRYYLDFWYIP